MNKSMMITIALLAVIGMMVATPTINVYAKKHNADRTESFSGGGPMSEQHPDPKRLISDDPAGSPRDVASIKGYAEGQKDYAKGIDKGFDAQPEGGHTIGYKSSELHQITIKKTDLSTTFFR